jgi:phosphoenolpyruvate-protein kinase (PTS system EI component)
MGFRELSMPAALLPEIKQEILGTNISELETSIKKILRTYDPQLIQELLGHVREQIFVV